MAKITLTIEGEQKIYDAGTTFEDIVAEYQIANDGLIALVRFNGKIQELSRKAEKDGEITFIRLDETIGHKTYERSAILLMVKAVHDVVGGDQDKKVKVEFSIGRGYYCSPRGTLTITDDFVARVKERMQQLVEEGVPFRKATLSTGEARKVFRAQGMDDKDRLFRYRRSSFVNAYDVDGYKDYYYGYMLPGTGYVRWFDVVPYDEGFMLMIPGKEEPKEVPEFKELPKLFKALKEATDWSSTMGVDTVGDLNDKISHGEMNDLILLQEALQERKISEIAKDIAARDGVKFVMIAGPSSSGKTSFSHRLSIQLASLGLKPHPIAVDDYFVDREKTPRDEKGDYNFECLEAIDVELFNQNMTDLLAGKRVELPTYNFLTGKSEFKGHFMQLGKEDILVIEGIHGLNDKMSYSLPTDSKYKIYISALTCLNIDEHNRIPTTDNRLLRRMVRDFRTRGASAKRTIQMWPSVRKGEEENIFPFQETADATFNSASIYELAALKQYAEPILFSIEPEDAEYDEAKRLLKFLDYFLGMPSDRLPNNSIVREFVGGSVFPV
ncbi:MAG: nucleoside kinase [Lachnospiraceae bacterium]|nr:nucleoside kinase [Lachnospiraceae bacterium]